MPVSLRIAIVFISFFYVQHSFAQRSRNSTFSAPNYRTYTFKNIEKDSLEFGLARRATIRSIILPGLGQITNKRWWKVPLIYGGFISLIISYNYNQAQYQSLLKESQYRVLNPGSYENPNYSRYGTPGILQAKDLYRRNRDICVLSIAGIYIANVIDAYVDAKFFQYDISDKLTLRIDPFLELTPQGVAYSELKPAIKISLALW